MSYTKYWIPFPFIDIYFIIELARNPPDGVSVGLSDDNLFKWELMIAGKFECHNIEYWTV